MKIKPLLLATYFGLISTLTFAATTTFDHSQRTKKDLARDVTAKPVQVIEFAGVRKGMTVADIFGGGGYYSELLSQAVGKTGKVYLHNNQEYLKFVDKELKQRLKAGRLTNVVDYKREADDLDFKANSLDAVFFVLGYHDMYHSSDDWQIDPKAVVAQLHQALKPGGLLLIIDHAAPDGTGTKHSQKLHRIDELYVKRELSNSGFTFIKDSALLRNSHDSRKISPFRPEIRRKTDRFVQLYKKD
jgi:predicted methyltransferase